MKTYQVKKTENKIQIIELFNKNIIQIFESDYNHTVGVYWMFAHCTSATAIQRLQVRQNIRTVYKK